MPGGGDSGGRNCDKLLQVGAPRGIEEKIQAPRAFPEFYGSIGKEKTAPVVRFRHKKQGCNSCNKFVTVIFLHVAQKKREDPPTKNSKNLETTIIDYLSEL